MIWYIALEDMQTIIKWVHVHLGLGLSQPESISIRRHRWNNKRSQNYDIWRVIFQVAVITCFKESSKWFEG